ncbi:alpha/beta hydrolase [Glutamicibacter sp. JL.03c]|uniref:alpha/beta hydrolase n=1 Tax=Glutamicibacter sp. JL.03c TaxID=2984842 RepID=UPI0021F7F664|nr:alpha/beta hydrolase [Glutamicibacter sp. JL.03c]UYQ77268.1 alpha/beta hydrolase [Glutamicibacter sp. JL.03c]
MTSSSSNHAVRSYLSVDYAGAESSALLMDLHVPADAPGEVPVVIWLHGGGWFTGDRTLAPDLAACAARTKMAFASIDYRLSGEAKFPAPLDDVITAIRHLRARGAQWGIDGARIGVWGASAGAHLAALAALKASAPAPEAPSDAQVACVVACYPPVDLEMIIAQRPAGRSWEQTPEGRLLGVDPETGPGQLVAQQASPLGHVSAQAPAFLICHGTADELVPPVHSQMLFERLEAESVPAELYLLQDYRHGFINPPGRLDVQLAAVMDDGRLEAEVRAPALARNTRQPGTRDTTFGFAEIENFLSAHLQAANPHRQTPRGHSES